MPHELKLSQRSTPGNDPLAGGGRGEGLFCSVEASSSDLPFVLKRREP